MGLYSGVLGDESLKRVFVQRGCRSFRRYASRTGRLYGTACIGRFRFCVGRTASLLLCWLDVSMRRVGRLFFRCRAMRFGTYDVQLRVRSEIPLLFQRLRRRAGFRRTAVGLMPLGCTSNGW